MSTRTEQSGRPADALVVVDELSVFESDGLCAGFARPQRGGHFVVATQSLSNLASAGGDKLLHAALDNARCSPSTARRCPAPPTRSFASVGGHPGGVGAHPQGLRRRRLRIGWDETGERARRLTRPVPRASERHQDARPA
jgi:hypothetical protein